MASYGFPYRDDEKIKPKTIVFDKSSSARLGHALDLVFPTDSMLLGLRKVLGLPVAVRAEKIDDDTWTKILKVHIFWKCLTHRLLHSGKDPIMSHFIVAMF
jgi:hypothetical protein